MTVVAHSCGDLGGEVVGQGVHHRQRLAGFGELGLGVAGVLDLVLLTRLGQGASRGCCRRRCR